MKWFAEEIMGSLTPSKSARRYNDAWDSSKNFATKLEEKPMATEELIQYLEHLKNETNYWQDQFSACL